MSAAGEELYKQREQRFNDIVALKRPDRVPIVPHVIHYFATKWKGISNRDAGFDHQRHYDCHQGRDASSSAGTSRRPTACSRPTATRRWAPRSCAGRAATCPTTPRSSSSRAST